MGFQVVLDDSDSTVSLVCTDHFQRPESSNILSCLSSLDADHAFVLVQEALARRRRATQVRISGCHHHWPQSQLLMPHLASDLFVYLPSFLLATLLLLLCFLASLNSSVFHCFSVLISSPSSQLLPSGELSLLACPRVTVSEAIFPTYYCLFVLFSYPFLTGLKRRAFR